MKARPRIPRFTGGFKSFSVSISINRESRVDTRLFVFSQGSRTKVFEFLWLKLLWDELSRLEFRLLISRIDKFSELEFSIIKSINYKGKRHTRERIQILVPDGTYSRERYQGFKRLDVEIYEFERSLVKTPKYSGWIRSASSKGSKHPSGESSFLEALTLTEYSFELEKKIDWFLLLTVDDNSEELFLWKLLESS